MVSSVFHAIIYNPLYNGLVYLVGILPGNDMGLAVIILTVIVRVVIYPLSRRAVQAQIDMKKIAPEIDALKEKHKNDREAQSRAIFALYKERDVHPFASFGLLLIQLPILFALYWIFARGGLPHIDTGLLYSFVSAPGAINMQFLGLFDMAGHSIILAALAALSQGLYTRLSLGSPKAHDTNIEASFSNDMARSFDMQARYVMPILIGVVGYSVVAAAPLYWCASNLFMIIQEYAAGRRFSD